MRIEVDTKYKCINCEGKGFNYHQPFGDAYKCSSCGGTGYANELDRNYQITKDLQIK